MIVHESKERGAGGRREKGNEGQSGGKRFDRDKKIVVDGWLAGSSLRWMMVGDERDRLGGRGEMGEGTD